MPGASRQIHINLRSIARGQITVVLNFCGICGCPEFDGVPVCPVHRTVEGISIYRIGVDVGGTNTDAVLMDGREVKAVHKAPTSARADEGILAAVRNVLILSGVAATDIQAVMMGTTHFTNTFVERRCLQNVGVIRLALPATRGVPPMMDWPTDIVALTGKHHYLVAGGFEFDGRPIAGLDEAAIAHAALDMREKGIRAVAISGVFSPVNDAMEVRAGEIVCDELPEAAVTLSSRIGRIGLLERENAAIINASLAALGADFVTSFRGALEELGINAPFYVSQNDGTLMSAEFVEQYPVLTFASGPTNSIRGAAYLTGLKDALVVDIGGTTTDVGVLVNGFPRESGLAAEVGGVRTNFRMPDILSIGLGGGSLVSSNGKTTVGPGSVAYRLAEQSRVFGGDRLTATDIAVAAGFAEIGNPAAVADLPEELVRETISLMHMRVEECLDRMKTSAAALPLILVGGGSVLIRGPVAGASKVVVPRKAEVANAIGACIAQVGGEINKVYSYEQLTREEALKHAQAEAAGQARDAGADENSIELIDIEETPLSYMPGSAVRIRAKAAGELRIC